MLPPLPWPHSGGSRRGTDAVHPGARPRTLGGPRSPTASGWPGSAGPSTRGPWWSVLSALPLGQKQLRLRHQAVKSSDGADTAEQTHFTSHLTSEHNTTMEKTISTVLLVSSVLGVFGKRLIKFWDNQNSLVSGKHIYVSVDITWAQAQKFCREHYTDLSSISSEWEEEQLRSVASRWLYRWMIGLYREPYNQTGWRWSGGGYATYFGTWALKQPNNGLLENYGFLYCDGWHNYENVPSPFFCSKLIMVRERKTWEEALEYCREQHIDLTSLGEQRGQTTTAHVWMGLRYLANRWLWGNGDPLEYEAPGWTASVSPPGTLTVGPLQRREGGRPGIVRRDSTSSATRDLLREEGPENLIWCISIVQIAFLSNSNKILILKIHFTSHLTSEHRNEEDHLHSAPHVQSVGAKRLMKASSWDNQHSLVSGKHIYVGQNMGTSSGVLQGALY
ncbi:unnamed protein product [Coregonus sp. 'balchen']|nr:unnamed protein product [Coregonus sp. 'balchen']